MTEVDTQKFLHLVATMRQAQREYFSTRDLTVLQKSKELERRVDQFIHEVTQPDIFGGDAQ